MFWVFFMFSDTQYVVQERLIHLPGSRLVFNAHTWQLWKCAVRECTDAHTYTHAQSHGAVIKVVNSASYSIFQPGLGRGLQSIRN